MTLLTDPAASFGFSLERVVLERTGQRVLNEVTLEVNQARVGLIGNNGSGKSSLVRLLNGLLKPTSGEVRVNGRNPADGPEAIAGQVGFIFQNPDHQIIFPTVLEEVAFGLRNLGRSRKAAQAEALAFLETQGRADWAQRPVHSLSEGQKQLVCIFAVLVMQPKLIVLDEPFSALDYPTRLHVLNWLHQLPQQLLMISHELDCLDGFDRLIWLDNGQVRGDGEPARILDAYRQASLAGVTL
ncbi:cobalt ABC transporter [Saccharospirillum sp. MSK14-1]|uniref:energy-coupling factor ABC transporter ATP-binding protein n=1 Tax=Saccharospirillum sp. MSK14-1 TaxID=1897632 RepID=UPI000D3978D9|nr:ABC transporter ATP-binding protein [Saccharospirillum sp. MSK14-1]PTY37201.1 cobalt ABC transporter [Saccharospirillum sp. MSK14-1]